MNDTLQKYGPLVSRILLAAIFIFSGVNKIFNFEGAVGYAGSSVLPMPEAMVILAIIFEVVGGMFLLIGYKTRLGAGLLIIFTLLAAVFFHTNFADQVEMIMFMKNLAIIGGLISIKVYGAGPISLDNRKTDLQTV